MSQLDEAEYSRLADQVLEIEKVMQSAQPGDVSVLLKSFLHNAKSRMEEIRHEEVRAVDERKDHAAKVVASAIQIAEMEHRLSATEKRQYAAFLQSEFFKKDDLDELEEFYTKSWDKLSEHGKTEMSTRVWEGIKRREYTFDELSEPVAEKETDRTYLQLTGKAQAVPNLPRFTPEARDEFVEKYESGEKKAASKILSRAASAEYPTDHRVEGAKSAPSTEKPSDQQDPNQKAQVQASEEISLEGLTLATVGSVSAHELTGSAVQVLKRG